MREIPFDRYPVIAADLIRNHGPAALSLVAEEHRQATIGCDAEGAAFWRLVSARMKNGPITCATACDHEQMPD
ncbi:hypothetical protein [Croceicoccus marinus]|uniref:Uncharacterized protein n=1 Tax=Croceicoccus marinus TaxID=450378 RepID=A0A1Z1FA55_9SPHN|nr:hypothetical protein [Croceicoccus marinus]ARU15632.1 hypothetical protein A9D14_04850 [Croceicoccus marinus]